MTRKKRNNNLHISLTSFQYESRVIKESRSLLKHKIADHVFIAALHEEGLKELECIQRRILLRRFKLSTKKMGNFILFQILKYLEFMARVAVFFFNKNIKILNVHSLALMPLGVLLKFIFRAKLIYDAHELETERVGFGKSKKMALKFLERLLIGFADQVIVVSDSIGDWYEETYSICRPNVIFNSPKLQKVEKGRYFHKYFKLDQEKKVFLYQGGLTLGRGIEELIESFVIRDDNKAVLVFMGYGPLEEFVKNSASTAKNIFFHKAVSPDCLLNYTASADFGLSIIIDCCLSYSYCMPNKLFEYLMAGLPVVVSNTVEMSNFVRKNELGVVVKEVTADEINKSIDNVMAMEILPFRARAEKVLREYSWESQEKRLIGSYAAIQF